MEPIGYIQSPYEESINIPIQGRFEQENKGCCVIDLKYQQGLKDLAGFSHAYLLYYFHKAFETQLVGKPFLEDEEHGIFAIRSPFRPNKIGITLVKIESIADNRLYFTGVDMLNGTPLLDIKPFVKEFDIVADSTSGWVAKHFENGNIPSQTFLNKTDDRND